MELLILKTGALGDVLRTTSILPGLRARYPEARITWATADGAEDLIRLHPMVDRVWTFRPDCAASRTRALERWSTVDWTRILSLDDEVPLCAMAEELLSACPGAQLTGAHLTEEGRPTYTEDAAPWFDMGLISKLGRAAADEGKKRNTETHRAIFARMVGVRAGEPQLLLPPEAEHFADRFVASMPGPLIGMNTGAGPRWESKRLDVGRTVSLLFECERRFAGSSLLLFGAAGEADRNAQILAESELPRLVDTGVNNDLFRFAALISRLDLLVTSDSLALHVAIARKIPVVVFFSPTSATEIDLFGRGEKVVSLADDACSYRPDADTSTLTVERLADAVERTLERYPHQGR